MALGNFDFERILRGRPSLRRRLSGFDKGTLNGFEGALGQPGNGETRSAARNTLTRLAEFQEQAAPVQARQDIETQLKDPKLLGPERDALNQQLRQNNAGFGSAAARFAPQNYGSVASRQFPSLYRTR